MKPASTIWKYDANARTVLDASGQTVICNVASSQGPAVGELIAKAPALAAIALELRASLGDALSAWHGEEDSVQTEHSDLIKGLEAANARAGAVLGELGDVWLPADTLRALAQALLERAQEIDGLRPYVVTHAHREGETVYTTWSATAPSDSQLARMVGEQFEPHRGETLEHHILTVAELTGASPDSRLTPDADDADQDEETSASDRPAGM